MILSPHSGSALPRRVFWVADHRSRRTPQRPFISVDDLNDWIGFLGGHPDACTANMDRLAARGASFSRAYCQALASGPSRASLHTGIRPHRSGVYLNNSVLRQSPLLASADTLPQRFRHHGYRAF